MIEGGKKIWLGNKGITLYETKGASFFAEDSINSKKLAVYALLETLRGVEEKLGINLKPYTFSTSREHYALIKNLLAIQCNKEGEKINIYDDSGRWLMVDDSLGEGGELENEGREALTTNKKMQRWWNDNKKQNFEVTPTFILQGFQALTESQKNLPIVLTKLEQQIESHLALIKEYRKENVSWRKEVKRKYKSDAEQKKITDF